MADKKYSIGYSLQKQYDVSGRAKRHIVLKTEGADEAHHRLLCTRTPGTYEYKGFKAAVDCDKCLKIANRPDRSLWP